MWFTRLEDGFRGWFSVEQGNGNLRTDLLAADFIVTVRDPTDVTGSLFEVTQSGKQGLYRFDVTSPFISSSGFGNYGVVVEVDTKAGPSGAPNVVRSFSEVLKVSKEDFDSLVSSIWNVSASLYNASGTMGGHVNTIVSASVVSINSGVTLTSASQDQLIDGIWDEPNNEHRLSGSTGDSIYSGSVANAPAPTIDIPAIVSGVWGAGADGFLVSGTMGFIMSQVSVISGCIDFIKQIESGRWRIDTGSNQMIFFRDDNVTEVARFDLFGSDGTPTTENPFERTRS